MKTSKKRLANKVRKLEVQNYDMRQKIKKMNKALTYLDELTTELNHALPDPEYDAQCEQNAVAVEESLARHAVRLGLVKAELTGSDLCRAMLERGDKVVLCKAYDHEENDFYYDAITSCSDVYFDSCLTSWSYAIPVNNQGEPLTASEVGL